MYSRRAFALTSALQTEILRRQPIVIKADTAKPFDQELL